MADLPSHPSSHGLLQKIRFPTRSLGVKSEKCPFLSSFRAVRVKKFLPGLLPGGFELGRRDVPVWPALSCDRTQVLTQLFDSGPAEKPVAIVDFINDQTGLEDNRVRDHRIVDRIRILGDVEIFLDCPRSVG